MVEQLAIIKNVGFGLRDVGFPCIWFETNISKSIGALQVLSGDKQIFGIIRESDVYDIKDLNGMSCWVEVKNNLIKYLRMSKI